MVVAILKLEGLFIFLFSIVCFYIINSHSVNWLMFVFFILLPDISLAGYFFNKKIGAMIYNTVHNFVFVIIVIYLGFTFGNIMVISLGFAFMAHVGIDRALGFGLKYPSDFKDTHMQKV